MISKICPSSLTAWTAYEKCHYVSSIVALFFSAGPVGLFAYDVYFSLTESAKARHSLMCDGADANACDLLSQIHSGSAEMMASSVTTVVLALFVLYFQFFRQKPFQCGKKTEIHEEGLLEGQSRALQETGSQRNAAHCFTVEWAIFFVALSAVGLAPFIINQNTGSVAGSAASFFYEHCHSSQLPWCDRESFSNSTCATMAYFNCATQGMGARWLIGSVVSPWVALVLSGPLVVFSLKHHFFKPSQSMQSDFELD